MLTTFSGGDFNLGGQLLTHMELPSAAMARRGVKMLLENLAEPDARIPSVALKGRLVRGTAILENK